MLRISSDEDVSKGLRELLRLDPRLKPAAERVGPIPLRLAPANFEGLASIIVSQQISKAAGETILSRLKLACDPLDSDSLLGAEDEALRLAGLSRAKRETLRTAALAEREGRIDLRALGEMPPAEAIEAMTLLKGIGPWTAEIYLLFCAGHADIFPAGDLALQESARMALGGEHRPDAKRLREIASIWSPWRGVAARLLWAYYSAMGRGGGAPDP